MAKTKIGSAFDAAIEKTKPPSKCPVCRLPPEIRSELDRRLQETEITAPAVRLALEKLGHPGIRVATIQLHRRSEHWEKK